MASGRKSKIVTIEAEGRDKNKMYLISEMSVTEIEGWAMRVLLALMKSNVELPDGVMDLGAAGLAEMGLKCLGGLQWEVAKPLLDEMLACVKIIPNPRNANVSRDLREDQGDIEELPTLLNLRMEVWKLHTGFLQAAGPSLLERAKAAKGSKSAIKTPAR
jgi:hypothetical protein